MASIMQRVRRMPIDRRTFLASGAAAAIASIASADPLKLGPLEPPSEKPVEQEPPADPYAKRLGIALVGIGHLAL
jgi:hypothetical protein